MNPFINSNLNVIRNIQKKGFFHLFSANLLIQLVAFASQLFVARILIPDDIGRIKIIQTYLSILSIVAGMGFNSSTLKLCSENRTAAEQVSLFRSALFFTIISTVSIYAIILLFNYLHLFSSDKIIQILIPLGLFPVITNSLFMVFVGYFQATKEIKLMSGLVSSNKVISIVAIVLFSYFWGIKGYYWAYNLSFIILLLVCFKVTKLLFSGKFSFNVYKSNIALHWKYAKLSTLSNIFSEISAYADILLIGFFIKDMHLIGYYSFALTLTVVIRLLPATVQQISIPYFSSFSGHKNDFIAKFRYYNKILILIIVITLILYCLLSSILIHEVFGNKFDESIQFLIPLAIGWSIRQMLQLQVSVVFGLGKVQYNLYTSLISMIFNFMIVSLALHFYGLIGAAYASIPSGIVILICSSYYFRRAHKETFRKIQ